MLLLISFSNVPSRGGVLVVDAAAVVVVGCAHFFRTIICCFSPNAHLSPLYAETNTHKERKRETYTQTDKETQRDTLTQTKSDC